MASSIARLADAFLIGMNAFNAFVLFTHLHHVDSPLKKPFISAKLRIVTVAHSTPFFVSTIFAILISITSCSAIKYSLTSNHAMLIRAIVSAYTFACTSIFVKLSNHMIKDTT